MGLMEWFNGLRKPKLAPSEHVVPFSVPKPDPTLKRCKKCQKMVPTWRIYANGLVACVSCSRYI